MRSGNGMKGPRQLLPTIHPPYGWRIVRTSLLLWLLIRLALVLISRTFLLATGASLVLIVATVLLSWWDGRRFNEILFHQNLGTPMHVGLAISFATVACVEICVMALARTLAG